jgi:hypothetical protein
MEISELVQKWLLEPINAAKFGNVREAEKVLVIVERICRYELWRGTDNALDRVGEYGAAAIMPDPVKIGTYKPESIKAEVLYKEYIRMWNELHTFIEQNKDEILQWILVSHNTKIA